MWTKFKGLFVASPDSQTAWRVFLRIESAVLFLAALAMFWKLAPAPPPWGLFVLFALLPEAAWLAYLYRRESSRWAALIYNAVHSYVTPILLLMLLWTFSPLYLLGWVANIAFLRVLGFGFHTPPRA